MAVDNAKSDSVGKLHCPPLLFRIPTVAHRRAVKRRRMGSFRPLWIWKWDFPPKLNNPDRNPTRTPTPSIIELESGLDLILWKFKTAHNGHLCVRKSIWFNIVVYQGRSYPSPWSSNTAHYGRCLWEGQCVLEACIRVIVRVPPLEKIRVRARVEKISNYGTIIISSYCC